MGIETRVAVLGVLGMVVSLYALHVESSMASNPFYEPSCVTRWGSCAAVFSSSYAHLLSHWGLVARRGPLDLSLATLGTFNYAVFAAFPYWPLRPATKASLLLAVSAGSCGFSVYLLYVLKVVLQDFCIVCTTFHVINFTTFFFAALPNYRRRVAEKAA